MLLEFPASANPLILAAFSAINHNPQSPIIQEVQMARTNQGILGNVSGRIGNVVGGAWKGIGYLRSYVIPNNPDTEAQQLQRLKMSTLVALAKSMLVGIIQKFWDPWALGMSGFNAFVKANKQTKGEPIDLAQIVITQGQLEAPSTPVPTLSGTNVVIAFTATCHSNGLATDKIAAVVYDKTNHIAFITDAGAIRSAASVTVAVGAGRTANDLYAAVIAYRGESPVTIVSSSTATIVEAE
jgi:hypothetical protein